jgi:hypothetical protein
MSSYDIQDTSIHKIINSEYELYQNNLSRSRIIECKINGYKIYVKKYRRLLLFVYSIIQNNIIENKELPESILNNSILSISKEKLNTKGYQYYNNLGISIRCADSKKTLREILNILRQKKDNIELILQLQNGAMIQFVMLTRFEYISI